jgi:hypothetical protein
MRLTMLIFLCAGGMTLGLPLETSTAHNCRRDAYGQRPGGRTPVVYTNTDFSLPDGTHLGTSCEVSISPTGVRRQGEPPNGLPGVR